MDTLLVTHEDCLQHCPGPGHPERPQRLRAVLDAVRDLPGLIEFPAPLAAEEQVLRVHAAEYLDMLRFAEPKEGLAQLDPDTFMSPGSLDAALRAAGAGCEAIELVLAGKFGNAFCATRPPGHHAESATAMGFCLLNHVAIGAAHALSLAEINHVAIVDFDVHHGNGTQAIFRSDPSVTYLSTHQQALYPWTGHADDQGHGNLHNVPLPADTGSDAFKAAFESRIEPALSAADPDLILVSAGFDAHKDDPLAGLNLEAEDYAWITEQLCRSADALCGGKVVSILEGGYGLDGLALSARAHVETLIRYARQRI